jgi:HK97 family phage major capsid protein
MRSKGIRAFLATVAGLLLAILSTGVIELLTAHPAEGLATLAIASGVAVLDRPLAQAKADLAKLLTELDAGQKEMQNGPIPQNRGEELDAKASEAEKLQAGIDQYERINGLTTKGRRVPNPTLPANDEQRKSGKRIVTTPGHLFVASDAYKGWRQSRSQSGMSAPVDVKNIRGSRVLLRGDEAEEFEAKAFSADTLSDLGDDAIIQVDRDPEIVRFGEPEILTLRDLLLVLPTQSDAVRFVRITAVDRAAASQATRGGLKPYLTLTAAPETVNVETIAVLSKVTEQDIEDAPRLVGIINEEMRLDVRNEEERQIAWGTGASGQLEGLFDPDSDVDDYEFDRAEVGDTLIDTIRRMRTDVRLRRLMPSGVAIHPIDWEEVELEKGSDQRYVWAVIQTVQGPRIWSMPVVESEAMENPATGERRLVVADWRRGATLYDRHDVRLAVGFVDDDFARNLRTLRAEERLALAVKRAHAFSWSTVQAAS